MSCLSFFMVQNIRNKSDEENVGRAGDDASRRGSALKGEESWGLRQKQESFIDILHHVKVCLYKVELSHRKI